MKEILNDIGDIPLKLVGKAIIDWWNNTTWLLGNACVVGYICYKIFGP
jgi:hypothetical protein